MRLSARHPPHFGGSKEKGIRADPSARPKTGTSIALATHLSAVVPAERLKRGLRASSTRNGARAGTPITALSIGQGVWVPRFRADDGGESGNGRRANSARWLFDNRRHGTLPGPLHRHGVRERVAVGPSLLRLEPGGLCDPVGLLDLGLEIRPELRGRAADPFDAEIGEPLADGRVIQ